MSPLGGLGEWIEGPHKAYATFPFIAAQGGLPIIVDGDLIGAIGVSGVKSFQDEQIAPRRDQGCVSGCEDGASGRGK